MCMYVCLCVCVYIYMYVCVCLRVRKSFIVLILLCNFFLNSRNLKSEIVTPWDISFWKDKVLEFKKKMMIELFTAIPKNMIIFPLFLPYSSNSSLIIQIKLSTTIPKFYNIRGIKLYTNLCLRQILLCNLVFIDPFFVGQHLTVLEN